MAAMTSSKNRQQFICGPCSVICVGSHLIIIMINTQGQIAQSHLVKQMFNRPQRCSNEIMVWKVVATLLLRGDQLKQEPNKIRFVYNNLKPPYWALWLTISLWQFEGVKPATNMAIVPNIVASSQLLARLCYLYLSSMLKPPPGQPCY